MKLQTIRTTETKRGYHMDRKNSRFTVLCVMFAVLVVTGNLIYQKFVALPVSFFWTIELSLGALLYPFTFLISDLITEFYGKKRARFCVHVAIIMNILITLIILGSDHLKATNWSRVDDHMFHEMFGFFSIAFIGSLIAFYIAQLVDIFLYAWIGRTKFGQWLWVKSLGSKVVSLLLDTTIVICFLCAFGVIPVEELWSLSLNTYVYKLMLTLLSLPVFYFSVHVINSLNDGKSFISILSWFRPVWNGDKYF